jgi:hypothetical protein
VSRFTLIAIAVCLAVGGCSGDGASTDSRAAVSAPLPIVDQIDDAVVALEAQLGGQQEFFEINATPQLVNLFVAMELATAVQPWVYIDGELSSKETQAAEGGTFLGVDLDFDPATIFSQLQSELPDATVESFYIHGDGQGAVQYGALLTTAQGGAIDVQLRSDGQIISSEPLN